MPPTVLSFFAPMTPATSVPWPLSSCAGVPGATQLVPSTAFSSGCVDRSIPVSITATFATLASCAVVGVAAPMRWTPVGTLSPAASGTKPTASSFWSGMTYATSGSASIAARWPGERAAAKPLSAAR